MAGVENYNNIGNRFISSKKKLAWDDPDVNGYQYSFQFPLNPERKKGEARVIYRPLDYFSKIGGDELFYKLLIKDIKQIDIVIHLKEFFPNGKWLEEEGGKYMKNGFGTDILNFLVKEGEVIGAKVIYVVTGKDKIGMRKFIKKNVFEPVDKESPENMRFFKMVGQKH